MGSAAPLGAIGMGFMELDINKKEMQAQTKALEDEAVIQEQNAKYIRTAGAFNASKQSMEAEQVFGGMRADVGASGISQDSGSVLDVLRQSYRNAELDHLNILYDSEIQALNADNRASAYRDQANNVRRQLPMRQAKTLLGIGAGAASMSGGGSAPASSGDGGGVSDGGGGGGYYRMRSS